MMDYTPSNWYWIVAGDESRVYSSKAGDYVALSDAGYVAWIAAGGQPSRIKNADELAEVLADSSVRPAQADMLRRLILWALAAEPPPNLDPSEFDRIRANQ